MPGRRLSLTFCGVAALILLGVAIAPLVRARLSWYVLDGHPQGATILVTCEAGTPVFRDIGFSMDQTSLPTFPEIDVLLACLMQTIYRTQILEDRKLFEGPSEALSALVTHHSWCDNERRFSKPLEEQCKTAHRKAIDWLLSNGVDINGGKQTTVLATTIDSLDQELFRFLLSRGADPRLAPPQSLFSSDPGVSELVDLVPKSALDLLELRIEKTDARDFPEAAQAWHNMVAAASQSAN